MSEPQIVTVIKQDANGRETWRYQAQVLQEEKNYILLEARFDREDHRLGSVTLQHGDRFIETYYFDRWYNIYAIHSREDDRLKVYYCNIGFPARHKDGMVTYRDLALDLLVFPDGKQVVLDEDEFKKLDLPEDVCQKALEALHELQENFSQQESAGNR